jgi:hypothetical protein
MDKFDLADYLVSKGVDEKKATEVKAQIDGNELMGLVDDIKSGRTARVNSRLGKYGIKIMSEAAMSDDLLNAQWESIREGKALDETFGVMTRVDEGFSYAVEVSEQTRDRVLDWLDENQVEYQATSPLSYNIECMDREAAYRTGRALSEILRKPTVRDSVEIEEKMSKNSNKRVNDAKAKMADMKPRNPLAAMPVAGRSGAHADGKDPRKSDKYGRGVKHKGRRFDEEIEFAIGEDVMVGEVSGQVKIPHGPNGTIGVIMNGQLEMVAETEVSRLDEGVIGMNKVNPLFRLRELAGLPLMDDDIAGIEVADAPEIDPEGILAAGPVGDVADDLGDLDAPEMAPAGEEPVDMGGDLDAELGSDLPDDAGIPGAIGTDPIEPVGMPGEMPMAPTQSEAMSQIEDGLNNIQTMLADIRLSEYKSLIQKLQDLTNQVQMMGRDYLGERRKK